MAFFTDFNPEGPFWRHDEVSLMAYAYDPQLTGQQLFASTWRNFCFRCTSALARLDALFRHFDPRGCGMVDLEGTLGHDWVK